MPLATHLFTFHFLVHLLLLHAPAFSQPSIHGSVSSDVLSHVSQLRVIVYNAHGQLVESVPVSPSLTFTLFQLPLTEGPHILYLYGSSSHEFHHIVVTILEKRLVLAYTRQNPLEAPLLSPPHHHTSHPDLLHPRIHFHPRGPTFFRPVPSKWSWTTFLRKYRSRALLIVAFIFLVWFPTVFRRLPKDLREELTGEKEPDLGDPNRVIKALLGDDDTPNKVTTKQIRS